MRTCNQLNPNTDQSATKLRMPGHFARHAGLGIAEPSASVRIVQTWIIDRSEPDPIAAIDRLVANDSHTQPSSNAGWMIMLSYELGRIIEPQAQRMPSKAAQIDRAAGFPLAVVQRWEACPAGVQAKPDGFEIGPIVSSMGRAGYIGAVERTKAYIRAGDIYQANIAHHLVAPFSGSASACFEALSRAAEPRLGSMMIFDHQGVRHAIGSISPELFFACDLSARTIRTEPMKGTRPIESDPEELRGSIKDRAELDMIIDLMRNDLGRVCALGSVRVLDPRKIEPHKSGVLQASAIIEGRLADGVGLGELIRATFPPGSVTGVPKVRAMQIIDELEHRPRDSYCGSIITLDDQGWLKASVSIRTAHMWGGIDPDRPDCIKGGWFDFPVGAGVVADSDPESEWAETLIKAGVLNSAVGLKVGLD